MTNVSPPRLVRPSTIVRPSGDHCAAPSQRDVSRGDVGPMLGSAKGRGVRYEQDFQRDISSPGTLLHEQIARGCPSDEPDPQIGVVHVSVRPDQDPCGRPRTGLAP
jgi:hypothetical protein